MDTHRRAHTHTCTHTHTPTRTSSEVIILEGKCGGLGRKSNHSTHPGKTKGDRAVVLILCGSRSTKTIWALNQMGKRIIKENLKDRYLIKEHKSIAVGKHFSYQFYLIVPDLSRNNKGSRWVYSLKFIGNSSDMKQGWGAVETYWLEVLIGFRYAISLNCPLENHSYFNLIC